jgi:hypothetical protein
VRSAMHSDQLALALLEEVSRARQGERWRMIVERMALRAEAAALDTLNEIAMKIASMREEQCRVRVADAEEGEAKAEAHLQEAEAELQRLRCRAQGAEADLRWAERDAEEDAELIGCLELQVEGWTAQWAEVLQADEDRRRVMRREGKQSS